MSPPSFSIYIINKMDNKQFKITYAKKQDAADIIALVHKVIDISLTNIYPPSAVSWFYEYHSVAHLEEEFDGGARVATIYDDKKIVGTATYYAKEIKRFFIHPDYQRMGLGKKLLCELESYAAKIKDNYIMLYANPATWKYYKAKGYETINIAAEEMDEGEYLAYCTMVKRIAPREWSVKKATEADAKKILDGQRKAFYDVARSHTHMDMPPLSETEDEIRAAFQKGLVFVAAENGEIVGSVRGEEKESACYVTRLWVLPYYQGKGVGQALMYAVEDAYKHLPKYELFTGSKSDKTIEFYKERGYVETKREPCRDYEFVFLKKMNAIKFLE